jgi:hypothetical protein
MNELKMRVTPHFTIILDSEDGAEPREWRLCYTYPAIAKVEAKLKKDIKNLSDWQNISTGDWPTIVWGGLGKFNPDVTIEDVIDLLNPEVQRGLSDAIFELMFPGVAAKYAKLLEDQKTGATADPNLQAVKTTA